MGKAWSLGFVERGGGRRRTGKQGPHIHVTGGEGGQKNTRQCLIPTIIYSPLFQCVCVCACAIIFRSFKRNFLSSVLGECTLSSASQPAEEDWHCQPATELPVKTAKASKAAAAYKKGGTTSREEDTHSGPQGKETVPLSSSWGGRTEAGLVLC